jgi:putative methyltransferase (TIGR04325 family)
MTDALEPCDVLYCNSVLQYFESNTPLLDVIETARPRYILLDDLLAQGEKDFFSTQVYYDTAMSHRLLGLQRLLADLDSRGYHRLSSVPFAAPILGTIKPLAMENFPTAFQLRYSLSMLLQRTPNACR